MERSEVLEQLQKYVVEQVLDGKNIDLDETSPLLEWGVMNSIEIVRLLIFIRKQFAIEIPPQQMIADNFVNLGAIANMMLSHQPEASMPAPDSTR